MSRFLLVSLAIVEVLFSFSLGASRADEATALAELIDRQIQTRLESEKLTYAPRADDAEFIRRLSLDLHGVVPAADRTTQFINSSDPNRRAQLIEELLASPRFGEYFGDVWRKRFISPLATDQRVQSDKFAGWLAARFNNNDGWDQIASDLLTATGKLEDNAAVTYLIEGRFPLSVTDLTDLSSRYFLGVRLNCAQCHDHPFVDWKRQDYWGMAAFFAQIQTPGRAKMVYVAGVRDDPRMTLATLKQADTIEGLQLIAPTFLGGKELKVGGKQTYRSALAEWTTSRDNPYFARAMVNRMWWHFFGRGIVNPVDDMHSGNTPSHPELLDQLSRRFAESGFDLKLLCRAIVSSRTYQQTSRPGDQDEAAAALFARMSIKVLTPEQLYDSLVSILGVPSKGGGASKGPALRHEFCQFFAGDGEPDPLRYDRGIPHLLRLMNSPQFAGSNLNTLVSKIQASHGSPDGVIEALFLSILSRRPTDVESRLVKAQLDDGKVSPQNAYRELAWALLMSSEFSLNH